MTNTRHPFGVEENNALPVFNAYMKRNNPDFKDLTAESSAKEFQHAFKLHQKAIANHDIGSTEENKAAFTLIGAMAPEVSQLKKKPACTIL